MDELTDPGLRRLAGLDPSEDEKPFDGPEMNAVAVRTGAFRNPQTVVQAGLSARLPAEQVRGGLKLSTGSEPPPEFDTSYGNELRLEQERDRFKGAQESTQGFITRRMAPFVSAVHNVREETAYADAVKRFRAGKPEEGDYAKIAGYERLQQIDKERSTGESIGAGVAHVPAILGEGWVAGKALGLGARALRGAEAVAPLAAGETVAQTSRLSQLGSFAGTTALKTGLMPSMYLAEAGKRAVANDGEWYHAKNLAPAFGMGMATVAVLGSLQKFVNEGSIPYQIAGKTLVGMGEQQAVDVSAQVLSDAVLNKAWKVDTGYGLAGDVYRAANGKDNQALKHALTQASVFGVFSAMHVFGSRKGATVDQVATEAAKLPAEVAAKYKEYVEKGYATLADKLLADYARAQTDITQHPNPTKEAVEAVAAEMTPGPLADIIKKQADVLPTEAEAAAKSLADLHAKWEDLATQTLQAKRDMERSYRSITSGPEGAAVYRTAFEKYRDLNREFDALSQTLGRGQYHGQTLDPDLSPKTETPNPPAETPVPDVVTHDPVELLGEAGVREFAKPLGLRSNAKIETILAGISKSPTLRAILENRVRNKVRESAQRTLPEVPETNRGPETAPESPVAGEVTRPVESPSVEAERPGVDAAEAARLEEEAWVRSRAGGETVKPLEITGKVTLGPPTVAKTHTGEGRIDHVIRDEAGKPVGDVRLVPRDGGLHLDWISTRDGEGRQVASGEAAGTFGARHLVEIVKQIAAAHPEAKTLTGLRAGGVHKGRVRGVDLDEVRAKASGRKVTSPETDIAPEPPPPAKTNREILMERAKKGGERRAAAKPQPLSDTRKPQALIDVLGAARQMQAEGTIEQIRPDEIDAFDAATRGTLDANERVVLLLRMDGLSHQAIADRGHETGELEKGASAKQANTAYTRARVQQIEAGAVKKLEAAGVGKAALDRLRETADRETADLAAKYLDGEVGDGELSHGRESDVLAVRRATTAEEAVVKDLDKVADQIIQLREELRRVRDIKTPTDKSRAAEARILARLAAIAERFAEPDRPAPVPVGGTGRAGAVVPRRGEQTPQAEGTQTPLKSPELPPAATHPGVAAALAERAKAPEGSAARRGLDAALGNLDAHPDEGTPRTGHDPKEVARRLVSARMELDNPTIGATRKDVNALDRVLKAAGVEEIGGRVGEVVPFDPVVHHDPGVPTGTPIKVVRPGWDLPGKSRYILEPAKVEPARAGDTAADFPPSRGSAAPRVASPEADLSAPPVTPAQIIADQGAILGRLHGAKDYRGESRVPGGFEARADLRAGQTTTSKEADQNPFTALEENAHHLSFKFGMETDPAKLPAAVVNGFLQMNRDHFDRTYLRNRVGMVEGYAAWVKLRAAGEAKNLTGDAKAASDWAEAWSKEKGLTAAYDRVGELYANYGSQTPTQLAQGLGSSTGRPAEVPRTAGEVATGVRDAFLDAIDNDLYPAARLEKAVEKAGRKPIPEENKLSTLLAASRTGNAATKASVWARDGVPVLTPDGRWQKAGPSVAEIEAGADPKWLEAGPNDAASQAGAYHTAWHLISNRMNGYARRDKALADMRAAADARDAATGDVREAMNKDVARLRSAYKDVLADTEAMIDAVPQEMFDAYKRALDAWNADPVFGPWAREFAPRLTAALDAQRRLLVSVGVISKEAAQAEREKYPTYSPLERVRGGDTGWNVTTPGKNGEKAPDVRKRRSGSGEAIVDPRLVYRQRLMKAAEIVNKNLAFHAFYKLVQSEGAGPFGAIYARDAATRTQAGLLRSEELKAAGIDPANLAAELKAMGAESADVLFRHEPWPTDGTKPTVEGLVDGKIVSVRVGDRSLYDLMTNQQVESNQTAKLLNAFANLSVGGFQPVKAQQAVVRTLATAANASFQARNVFPTRDPLVFWQNTVDRASVKQLPAEYWKTYGRLFRVMLDNGREYFGGKEARRDAPEDPLWRAFVDARGDQLKQFAFERDNPEGTYNGIKSTPTFRSLVKDVLNFMGAGELAPRFLEWKNKARQITGESESEVRKAYQDYYDSLASGGKPEAPLTYRQEALLMNAAWEVTAPFPRQGTVTRQFNQITPFFGPAVSGVSKAIRNWKSNAKGAAMGLGLMAAARALHWALVKDEPWYDELSPSDKFNNFVIPTPAGPRRIPGPRDLDIAAGGAVVTMLDAAADKHPDFKGYFQQSLQGVLPPGIGPAAADLAKGDVGMAAARAGAMPLGPVGTTGVELMMNKDWTGKPIVPRREEDKTTQWDKFVDRQGPYALKQLTGGRGELTLSGSGLNLVPRVMSLHRSVDELYDRLHDLEIDKAKAAKAGARFADAAEYSRLEAARKQITDLAAKGRGEKKVGAKVVAGEKPEDDIRQELSLKQAEIARRALRR